MIFIVTICVCLGLSRVQPTATVTHTVCILMHQSVVIRLSIFAHMYGWISTISPGFQSHLCTIVADTAHVRCTTLIRLIIV